jgi:hypothetical protein
MGLDETRWIGEASMSFDILDGRFAVALINLSSLECLDTTSIF